MKYMVIGNTKVTISIFVKADTPEEAMRKAGEQFNSIKSNKGYIGIINNISFIEEEPVVFDDYIQV